MKDFYEVGEKMTTIGHKMAFYEFMSFLKIAKKTKTEKLCYVVKFLIQLCNTKSKCISRKSGLISCKQKHLKQNI